MENIPAFIQMRVLLLLWTALIMCNLTADFTVQSATKEHVFVNDDQQDATILAYLFIPNQLYLFRAISLPIIRST